MASDLIWHTEKRLVKECKEHSKNPRKISPEQMEQLKESIRKFNYVEMVALNLDNTLLAGHMRIKALKSLGRGKEEIEVRVPNRQLTEKEAEEYLIRSNKNTGDWDWDRLANDWDVPDLFEWGFTESELEMKNPKKVEVEEDDFDATPPQEAITKPGDIYQLDRHKLLCGSATIYDDIKKLLDSQMIDLIVTDPPYNVTYSGKTEKKLTIQNDSLSDENFENLLHDFYINAFVFLKEGGSIYVFHADLEGEKFRRYFREANLKLSQCLIWVKDSMVIGRKDYHWQHESILYGWKEGAAHNWCNDRKQTTTLHFDRPTKNIEHPTMKPLPLIGYLIQNNSKENEIIFDFFLGSGSTLMASEQINRICYGTELDPRYCDVIVKRYLNHKITKNEPFEISRNGKILDKKELEELCH